MEEKKLAYSSRKAGFEPNEMAQRAQGRNFLIKEDRIRMNEQFTGDS